MRATVAFNGLTKDHFRLKISRIIFQHLDSRIYILIQTIQSCISHRVLPEMLPKISIPICQSYCLKYRQHGVLVWLSHTSKLTKHGNTLECIHILSIILNR